MRHIKLGIISDTHGQVAQTRQAVEIFRGQGVSVIIHCGDIGGEAVIRLFQGIETHFVLGNTDGDEPRLRFLATETGNTLHGWFGSLESAGKKIAFLHGHQGEVFDMELKSGRWDLICYGHTHCPAFFQQGHTLLVNPGAFKRVETPRVAVMTLPDMTLESFAVYNTTSATL